VACRPCRRAGLRPAEALEHLAEPEHKAALQEGGDGGSFYSCQATTGLPDIHVQNIPAFLGMAAFRARAEVLGSLTKCKFINQPHSRGELKHAYINYEDPEDYNKAKEVFGKVYLQANGEKYNHEKKAESEDESIEELFKQLGPRHPEVSQSSEEDGSKDDAGLQELPGEEYVWQSSSDEEGADGREKLEEGEDKKLFRQQEAILAEVAQRREQERGDWRLAMALQERER
jgi:hypothetical protein